MIDILQTYGNVTVASIDKDKQLKASFINPPTANRFSSRIRKGYTLLSALRLHAPINEYEGKLLLGSINDLDRYDLIFLFDIRLLPYILKRRGRSKIWIDAREYYPQHFSDIRWKLFNGQRMDSICRNYLHAADLIFTVSPSLAREYKKHYGIRTTLLHSYEAYHEATPSPVDPSAIKLVHHGSSNPNRELERLIFMMDHLGHKFSLDLFLLANNPKYVNKLKQLARTRSNVKIHPPLAYTEIVSQTVKFDIGIFMTPPNSKNLALMLPNKFFQFVQARLAVASGPTQDMAEIIRTQKNGIVFEGFEAESAAQTLKRFSYKDIAEMKQNSHRIAHEFSTEHQHILIKNCLNQTGLL